MSRQIAAFALYGCIACAACGGAQKEAQSPEADTEASAQGTQKSGMQVQTELGVIDARAVEQTFHRLAGKLEACHKSGLARVEYLAGDVRVFLRVGENGSVKYGYLEESTLGDRESEKCLLGVLTATTWPKPEGGEAEVRNNFGFDPPEDVRAPIDWNAARVAESLEKSSGDIQKCKEGVGGHFRVTAYVVPEGKLGKFSAVGASASSKEGAEKIDCLIDALKAITPPSPGSYPAKVSFDL